MPTLKEYETLVKKINDTPESKSEERSELAKQKAAIADNLRSKAKGRAGKRELKLKFDEINNTV